MHLLSDTAFAETYQESSQAQINKDYNFLISVMFLYNVEW